MIRFMIAKTTWDGKFESFGDQLRPGFEEKIYDTHASAEKDITRLVAQADEMNKHFSSDPDFSRTWEPALINGMLCGGVLTYANTKVGVRVFVEKYWIKPIAIESTIQAQRLKMKGDDI